MFQSNCGGGEEYPDYKWGAKKEVGRANKTVSYESFTYKGIEYKLLDCAYFLVEVQCETSIGKIVKMYKTSRGEKKIKVIWFFRPIDIHNFLGAYEPQWDELFMACGDENGVYSIHDVEEVIGKCSVVCLSKDSRNPQPTRHELRIAHYVFSCTFDTGLNIISEDFADAIARIRVENFFNKAINKQPINCINSSTTSSSKASPVRYFHSELEKYNNRNEKLKSRPSLVQKGFSWEDCLDHLQVKKSPPVNFSRVLKIRTRGIGDLLASGSSVNRESSTKRKLRTPDDSDDSTRREQFH